MQTLPGDGLRESPRLLAGTKNQLFLTGIAATPAGDVVRLYRSEAGTWQHPVEVTSPGRPVFVNWADTPAALGFDDTSIVAVWPERFVDNENQPTQGYGLRMSRSRDRGNTWDDPMYLHTHIGGPEYGFVSLVLQAKTSSITAFWLDGRDSQGHDGGQMQLRSAVLTASGPPSKRTQVDPRVCDCCQTSADLVGGQSLVAYRDRSDAEIRDIALAGAGGPPTNIHDDAWKFAGCPVNGPALAANDYHTAIAWFTAAGDNPRVQLAFADPSGSFGEPVVVHRGQAIGRVALAWVDQSHVAITYVEARVAGGERAQIVVRLVDRQGQLGPAFQVADTENSRAAGFPQMVRSGADLVWAWTDVSQDPPRVVVAKTGATKLAKPSV